MSKPQKVSVELGPRSYTIHIGQGLLQSELSHILAGCVKARQCFVISNPTVFDLYGDLVVSQLRQLQNDMQVDVFLMPDGEQHKNMQVFAQALDELMQTKHNRTTCVVALGGGVVGDLAGFAAATFQRGVDFVQVPTTLLSQVDSSVGGKTAVNHPGGKNMIGAFYQPKSVVIDTQVLSSLPQREYAAGLAEVVKYGVIFDADFFAWQESNVQGLRDQNTIVLSHAIQRSCEIKAQVVAEDERESGLRAILNFGHTFGHGIENTLGYGELLHGEAVAIGMVMATEFSHRLGLVEKLDVERVTQLLGSLGLPIELGRHKVSTEQLMQSMGMDKKVADGKLRFILVNKIGEVFVTDDDKRSYDVDTLEGLLNDFCS